MGKIQFNITCAICEVASPYVGKKPNYHTPTIARFNCPSCKSRFLISLSKTDEAGKLAVDLNPLEVGAKGIELLKAKAAALTKQLEETANAEKPNGEVQAAAPTAPEHT